MIRIRTPNTKSIVVFFGVLSLFSLIFFANFIVVTGVPFYFLMTILGTIILLFISGEKYLLINIQDFFVLLFLFWLLIPVFNAHDITSSLLQYYYYLICFSLFFFVRRICFSRRDWFLLGQAILYGGMVTSVLMFANWNVIFQGDRVNINGINANYLAYSLVTLLPLLYIFICNNDRFYYVILLFFSLAIFLTGSRGAFAALLLFYILLSFKKPMFGLFLVLIIITCFTMLLGFYDSLPQYWQVRFDFHNSTNNNIDWSSGREDTWSMALKLFNENSVFGIGPNNFGEVSGFQIGVHNVFLSLLVETGILGFIFYFLIFTSILIFIMKRNLYLGFIFFAVELPIFLTGVWESSPVLWSVASLLMAYVVLFSEKNRGNQ